MGGYLAKNSQSTYDQDLINQLKQNSCRDWSECISVISQDYYGQQYVDIEHFNDIFGIHLDDVNPYFLLLQNDHNIDGTVDINEVLAALIFFSGDNFENKIALIFQLFDFDNNNSLDIKELLLTLQSVARGLCKFVKIELPTLKEIEILTIEVFTGMDVDHDKRIIGSEFVEWINQNDEIQEFLVKHAGLQTYQRTRNRFYAIYSTFTDLFALATTTPGSTYVKELPLKEIVRIRAHEYIGEGHFDFFFDLLRSSSESASQTSQEDSSISKQTYEAIARAWSVFSATDIRNDDKLSMNELRILLRIYEDEEPSDARFLIEVNEIDKDCNSLITRKEWMTNFCTLDNGRKFVFKHSLRELFEKLDRDRSGTLSFEEFMSASMDAFSDHLKANKDETRKKLLEGMIRSIAQEIFKELNTTQDGHVKWSEFKSYLDVAIKKYRCLRDFLEANLKPVGS